MTCSAVNMGIEEVFYLRGGNTVKKFGLDCVITLLGVVSIAPGLFLVKTIDAPQGFMLAFPYILVGVGCGTFGHGMGNVILRKATQKDPTVQKRLAIETNDERTIAIENRAKAKAFNLRCKGFGRICPNPLHLNKTKQKRLEALMQNGFLFCSADII